MSWIGITALASFFIIFVMQLASYRKGYSQGFKEGYKEAQVLKDLPPIPNNIKDRKEPKLGDLNV